jgi:hypothetical protein
MLSEVLEIRLEEPVPEELSSARLIARIADVTLPPATLRAGQTIVRIEASAATRPDGELVWVVVRLAGGASLPPIHELRFVAAASP